MTDTINPVNRIHMQLIHKIKELFFRKEEAEYKQATTFDELRCSECTMLNTTVKIENCLDRIFSNLHDGAAALHSAIELQSLSHSLVLDLDGEWEAGASVGSAAATFTGDNLPIDVICQRVDHNRQEVVKYIADEQTADDIRLGAMRQAAVFLHTDATLLLCVVAANVKCGGLLRKPAKNESGE